MGATLSADHSVRVWTATSSFLGFGAPHCKTTLPCNEPSDADALDQTRLLWTANDAGLVLKRFNEPDQAFQNVLL